MNDCTDSCTKCPLLGLCGDPLPGMREESDLSGGRADTEDATQTDGGAPLFVVGQVTPVCVQTPTGRVSCGSGSVVTSPEADKVAAALHDAYAAGFDGDGDYSVYVTATELLASLKRVDPCCSADTDAPDVSPSADMVARLADVLADADSPAAPGETVSYETLALAALAHLGLIGA